MMEIQLKYIEIYLLGEIRCAKYFYLFQPPREIIFPLYFNCISTVFQFDTPNTYMLL